MGRSSGTVRSVASSYEDGVAEEQEKIRLKASRVEVLEQMIYE